MLYGSVALSRTWIQWAKLPCVVAIGLLLSTLIDPYISLHTDLLVQVVNAALPLAVLLLVWGLSGRAWWGLLLEVMALGGLRYADHLKVMYLATDLVYADFTILKGLLGDPKLILGFVQIGWHLILGLAVGVTAIVAVAWATHKWRPASWRLRATCLGIGVAVVVAVSVGGVPAVIPALNWEVYAQARGAKDVGVAGNILLGKMTSADVERKADPAKERAFWREPLVQRFKQQIESGTSGQRPDIVIVQSESLFMPSQLNGFANTPLLTHITNQDAGFLDVPVFGGRTLQTEFEVQTGAPIAFFPGSMFAYYELLHYRVDALPHVLDRHGYKTMVIHPNERGFWNRDAAMPELGFATFQDVGSFMPSDYSPHGHVRDLTLMRAVLSELDASDRPTYVTAITMDNHGPWGDPVPGGDTDLGLPVKLTGIARQQMADYVSRAKDADKAFGYLIEALQRRQRPTIVAIYGDHLPALYPVYHQLGFKDGKPPESHMPPYRVWANFPISTPPHVLPAYLLQGFLLRQAGLSMQGHELANAIAGMVETDATISRTDRDRILEEYDNVAAANLQRVAGQPDPDQKTIFIRRKDALAALDSIAAVKVDAGRMSREDGDMYLRPDASGVAGVSFDLHQRIASVSLRPYIRCLPGADAGNGASLAVHADGKLMYEAPIGSRDMRLMTFEVRDVKRLQLTVRGSGVAAARCGIYVRLTQILKCVGTCKASPADAISPPARIVDNDPTQGDLKALGPVVSGQGNASVSRAVNMKWLLHHEVARRDGAAPITLQSDGQLFMHPADDHDAWIEFDVNGLSSIDLTPHINALDDKCKALGPQAGVVALTVLADGKPVTNKLTIDRYYDKPLHIDLDSAHSLRIDVNKGNQVTWCDWFSVGVDHLGFAREPVSAPSPFASDR